MTDQEILGAAMAYTDKHGGGGGTSDYPQLTNKPQINGTTLVGNKSASDLSLASLDANGKVPSSQLPSYVDDVVEGYYDASTDRFYEDSTFETVITPVEGKSWVDIPANKSYRWTGSVYVRVDEGVQIGETSDTAYAGNKGKANADAITAIKDGTDIDSFGDVETALADKQNTITAGLYIQKSGDTISVKRDVSENVDEVLTLTHDTSGGTNKINAVLTVGGETIDSETITTSGGTFHDLVQISFNGQAVRFKFKYLVASKTQSAGYENYIYSEYTDTFVETIGEESKLIIKSELDTALSGKQDTLTFDDVPTANSNNPVKSGGVKSAIDAAVSSAYHHAGTKTCVELVAGLLVAANEGNVYNMTDSGTTTSDFIEGTGQPIKAGDNVGIAKISDGVYKFDLLSGFIDTTNFVQKSQTAGLLKNDGTVNDEIEEDVSKLKSGFTNLDNEVNGDATTYPYADVITIEDAVPANLADCSVKIEPEQDLHGFDKPWVGGAGKNKENVTLTTGTYSGVTWTVYDDKRIKISGTVPEGGVTLNTAIADVDTTALAGYKFIYSTEGNGDVYARIMNSDLTSNLQDLSDNTVIADNGSNCKLVYRVVNNNNYDVTVSSMIVASTETDTSYAPYTNICPISGHTEASVQVADDAENPTVTKTYTIALGDTIYGGTVDFNTGLMTVTHRYIDISTLSWTYHTGYTSPAWRATLQGVKQSESASTAPDMVADTFPTLSVNEITVDGNYGISISSSVARILCNNGSSEVSPTGNMAYPIDTPFTVQLTPQQIQLLKGQNTLTASTGDISVTVNGVSGAIGTVQEQVNATDEALADIAEKLPTAPTTDGAYVLTVTVADGTPTYSWESAT